VTILEGPTTDDVRIRPLEKSDLDAADRIMRVAFGTFLGLPDPGSMFGDAEVVRTRFRAAPDCAWAAEVGGEVVGSVFACRWGTFGFFGPLTTHPDVWNRGIGGRLMAPVMEAFDRWDLSQAGLFTFPDSPKHVGLYQRFGFWPRFLTPLTAKPVTGAAGDYTVFSSVPGAERAATLDSIRELTNAVFPGLDLEREIVACDEQTLGDTVLVHDDGRLAGVAICHCGARSEAGSGTCFVKFGAARPGAEAAGRFERLLDACDAFAADADLVRLVAGVNTGRRDAYRLMLQRGYETERIGLAMRLRPDGPDYDGPEQYVIDDLR
jgi:GNAT superfamily N-acetyltransferase